jgi:hypothetical protein
MKFLNGWSISIDKLPAYSAFKKPSYIDVDYHFFEKMYNSQLDVFTQNKKLLLFPILKSINPKTNTLDISYSQRYGLGRHYPKNSISPICISRDFKHTFFDHFNWIDLDMVKGHPTILYSIAQKNGLSLSSFETYLKNPDDIFNLLSAYYSSPDSTPLSNDNIKDIFNISIYGGGHNTWLKQMAEQNLEIATATPHPFVSSFIAECQMIIDIVYHSNAEIKNKVSGDLTDEYSIKTRVMSYFCGAIENDIIYTVYKLLEKRSIINANSCLLEYDGICFKKPDMDIDYDALLTDINDKILKETKMPIKMKWKPYNPIHVHTDAVLKEKNISLADDETEIESTTESANSANIETFDIVSTEFEKYHCKIGSKSIFVRNYNNRINLLNRNQLKTSYEHMIYQKETIRYEKGQPIVEYVEKNFINDWLINNPNQRCYDDIGCYPRGTICPPNCFNSWIPFDMELITEYTPNPEGRDFILNHIKILCNYEIPVYDYIIKWIAQMIQYPAVKSICPVFISKEGAGKSSLIRLFEKMFGGEKCIESADPMRDVWGQFNNRMANSFLVNLNELSKKDTVDSLGKIKSLITEPKLTINGKGVPSYDMDSYQRFVITTNSEEPIESKEDNRRLIIIRSSDDLIGNKEYFKKLYEYINNMNVVKTVFEYFFTSEDMKEFNKIEKPITEYQQELQTMSASPIELWLKHLTEENCDFDFIEKTSDECYGLFCEWLSSNNIEYHCNNIKFGVRLSRLSISKDSIKTIKRAKGNSRVFDIEKLKKYFGVGCLLV